MPTSLSTPASVVNAALARVGYKQFVGQLHDGSMAAQVALQIFGQTRDDLLKSSDWDFASRTATLTLLKSAPPGGYIPGFTPWDPVNCPPLGYKFEYGYPADALEVRSVRPTPIFVSNADPRPWPFRISNDNNYTPARRVVLTNLGDAVAVYTGRVVDLTTMPVDFVQALVETLAEPLGIALNAMDAAKANAVESRADTAMAKMEQG